MSEKDFRVRKGLVVDGTGTSSIAGSLGIGTTTVNGQLHVRDTSDGSDQYSGIRFYPADSETSSTDPDFYHQITGFRKGGLMLTGGQSGNYTRTYATLNNDGFKVFTNAGDNTAVNMSTQQRLLIPTGGGSATLSVGLDVTGTVSATTFSGPLSGTVQPKTTVASAGNNTANYYAKLMTFDPDGGNYRDANAILAITTKDNGANASAMIHVKFRSNNTNDAYTTDVSFISKSGNAIFNNDAFQIWSTGNGGGGNTEVMELWVQKNTSFTGLDVHEVSLDKSSGGTVTYTGSTSWQSAAPTTTQQTTTQGIEMGLDVTVDGSLSATTKSFDIKHPTKEGMRLHHGSLEGPEHGVYHRGVGASSVVELPDYWTGLVDEDSITVQLTPKGSFQQLFVRKVEGNKVHVDAVDGGELSFYYNIYGTRKDVGKMEVEY